MKFNDLRGMFFDRKAVTNAVDRATRKVLGKFGAYVRTTARSSIRRRKKVSAPGQPPTSWTGLLKRFLFFAYEPDRKSVVIGPARFDKSDGEALPLLEYGGRTTRRDRKGKRRAANYRARPYMGPAFEKERKKLPDLWRDSVR